MFSSRLAIGIASWKIQTILTMPDNIKKAQTSMSGLMN
jgi:hypothetical protein